MKFKNYMKKLGWKLRLRVKLAKWWYELKAKIGLCKHDGTFGEVGAKYCYCAWCGKKIINEDYEN